MADLVYHPLPPIYNRDSKILILGTIPSPKSRKNGFYYTHPQNRFWKIMGQLFGEDIPCTTEQRISFLLRRRIALWDVVQSCRINGADDGSIQDVVPNDIAGILPGTFISTIFTTGTKATALYKRLCLPFTGIPPIYLPSTSPANCRFYSMSALTEAYRLIFHYL